MLNLRNIPDRRIKEKGQMKAQVMNRTRAMQSADPNKVLICIGSNHFFNYDFEHSERISYSVRPEKGDWLDFIEVFFDDIVIKDETTLDIPMSFDQAEDIHSFIKQWEGKEFVINCDAGMSRSAAVGSYMNLFHGYDVEYFETKSDEYKNRRVFEMLYMTHMRNQHK